MVKAARATLAMALTLASAALCLPGWLQAMEIEKFDKMADADQGEYVANLVVGAQKVLRDEGRADDAEKVHHLFTTKDPEGDVSIGLTQFEILLARARVHDLERIATDPNARRLKVEDAMFVTLKKNDIILPRASLPL